jgi:hypothetical protein
VAEADRDEQLAVPDVVEAVGLPLAVGGRAAAQIDRDVEDLAAGAADQLRLPPLGLEVDPSQRPLRAARVVVLDELDLDAELAPGLAAVGLEHEAALVAVDDGLDQGDAVELRLQPLRH